MNVRMLVLLASTFLAAPTPAWATPQAGDGLVFEYAIAPTFTLHEPIVATVTVENRSNRRISVDLGPDRTDNFIVEPAPGSPLRRRQPPNELARLAEWGMITLTAGERYQQRLLLNAWFEFEHEGAYEMAIHLRSSEESAKSTDVSAGTLRFHVLPRSERVLRAVCAQLAATIATEPKVGLRYQAVRELLAIRDPVVVPYVAQTLASTDRVDSMLIGGLRELGGSASKALVEQLARSANAERATLAGDVLRRWR